jgi:hypothetical protein
VLGVRGMVDGDHNVITGYQVLLVPRWREGPPPRKGEGGPPFKVARDGPGLLR